LIINLKSNLYMSDSSSVLSDVKSSELSKPVILSSLRDLDIPGKICPPHTQQQIDLILLALEALEVGGGEQMLALAKQLELEDIIKNRVEFWRLRCTNFWRKSYNRDHLTLDQAKSLVIIASYRAKTLTVLIRQLLNFEQEMRTRNLPLGTNFFLSEYLERFRSHFRSRMNPRRAKISIYLASESALDELAISLLNKLLFCTGTKGMERFWVSLFDGEVA
jgi:Protein of unknown function (DUF3038)